MHQFIIKKGKTIENTPEFISFKRLNITKWGSVSLIIHMLEKMMDLYNVQHACIDGTRVVDLADDELTQPTQDDLFDCIINKN